MNGSHLHNVNGSQLECKGVLLKEEMIKLQKQKSKIKKQKVELEQVDQNDECDQDEGSDDLDGFKVLGNKSKLNASFSKPGKIGDGRKLDTDKSDKRETNSVRDQGYTPLAPIIYSPEIPQPHINVPYPPYPAYAPYPAYSPYPAYNSYIPYAAPVASSPCYGMPHMSVAYRVSSGVEGGGFPEVQLAPPGFYYTSNLGGYSREGQDAFRYLPTKTKSALSEEKQLKCTRHAKSEAERDYRCDALDLGPDQDIFHAPEKSDVAVIDAGDQKAVRERVATNVSSFDPGRSTLEISAGDLLKAPNNRSLTNFIDSSFGKQMTEEELVNQYLLKQGRLTSDDKCQLKTFNKRPQYNLTKLEEDEEEFEVLPLAIVIEDEDTFDVDDFKIIK